jgi:mRNA-degrading endonuclease RelE of RelBE toxin-antitoxin system
MPGKEPYSLIYDPEIAGQLSQIEAKHHSLIRTTIEEQLSFEPEVQTRNRKPLKQTAKLAAKWEIRFGPSNRFRVFYSVNGQTREVNVLAIGVKLNNRLFIGGQEVEL